MRAPVKSVSASIAALAIASLFAPSAIAQETQDQAAPAESGVDDEQDGETIIVTGSRLARSTFDTPTPVTVLGAEDFDRLQITNVGEGVAELPAFRPSNNPSTNGFGSFNVGAQIVNLRGLGVTRNLVLVDGRRFAPTTREGSVDLNFVPSTLVSRVEVVTGGASAAYGSDALAGAVNVILDTRLEGLKAQLDYGIAEEGDGANLHAGAAYGTSFAGGAGHFVIGGEYSDQEKVGSCFTRDWCQVGAVVTNPNYASTNPAAIGFGQPQYVRSDTAGGWYFNSAGVVSRINNATGVGNTVANSRNVPGGTQYGAITFAPNGAVLPYDNYNTVASGLSQIGGDLYPTYSEVDLVAPVERYAVFAHADYDFSDALSGFLEGSYGHVDGGTFQAAYFTTSIPIYYDNPFVPAGVRAVFPVGRRTQPTAPDATRTQALAMARVFSDIARGFSRSKADTYRVTGGLSGELGGNLTWDAYYQYGRTDRLQTVDDNLVVAGPTPFFSWAADVVVNPATGTPTCRVLLSPDPAVRAAAAGCVPINLFGAGNVTAAGRDYIYEQLREDIDLSQHVAAANLRGDIEGDLLAGPLSFAVGAEYRVDKIDVLHDDLSNVFAYFQNFGADYNGKTEVIEGYLEVELPIVEDVPFFNSLVVNGAVRQARYDISGFGSYLRTQAETEFDATTWKVSLNWEPVDWLRLRATQSRDIRAPNFAELFLASASSFAPVSNPFVLNAGARTTNFPTTVTGGSPTLRPEEADTTTVGLVFSPEGGALDGLRFSVDAYRIKVRDYISTAPGGSQFMIDRCFAGVAEACTTFDRDPATGAIVRVRNVSLNLDQILAKGIDFEADYRIDLDDENALLLRGIATYVDTLKSVSFGDEVDRAGQTGNSAGLAAPEWVLNGTATFQAPQWSASLQGRYIDSGLYDAQRIGPDDPRYATTLLNSISDNRVASRFYLNLFASVRPDERFELFGSVSNLLGTDPPAAPETQFYTNPVYFDTLGRYFRVGARVRL